MIMLVSKMLDSIGEQRKTSGILKNADDLAMVENANKLLRI
ncbi:hypothetical protein [Pediococcus stilesii]|nr:hypothetical protein [Pediococcus stilesii]